MGVEDAREEIRRQGLAVLFGKVCRHRECLLGHLCPPRGQMVAGNDVE